MAYILKKHQDLLKFMAKINKWIMQNPYTNGFLAPQGIHCNTV